MTLQTAWSDDALKRAAGYALCEVATQPGRLLTALRQLGYGVESAKSLAASAVDVQKVKFALGSDLLQRVADATGQGTERLAETVGRQLGVVAVFAELDGGKLDDNVVAVEKLIQSGRVDLFTRR